MKYSIFIVTPPHYTHSRCFEEVAHSLNEALIGLGQQSSITTIIDKTADKTIILGAHLLHPEDIGNIPGGIIYQLEQLPSVSDTTRTSLAITENYWTILSQAEIWDYSERNIDILSTHGIKAKLLPIGYSPGLTNILPATEDIDVLHMGSMNPRRGKILYELQSRGLKVMQLFNCYGKERDAFIAKAKVIINIHYYDAKIFEIVRCSYLMANRKFVLSEHGLDEKLETPYSAGIAFTPYVYLVRDCVKYLSRPEMMDMRKNIGFDIFSKRLQSDFLKEVL